jgi:MFS family permease
MMSDGKQMAEVSRDVSPTQAIQGDDTGLMIEGASSDPVYTAKSLRLNKAVQDIGMGRYQWQLFVVIGFGWASDNMWPVITSLILTPVTNEFSVSRPPFLSLAQNIGLLVGAIFWGFGCDIFGRRWAFNLTIGITAVFGLISAGSPNFAAIATFAALWSVGVGGNLPVDSAIFLEFLPGSHQYLLTVLSVYWALAQLLTTLIAWPLLGYHTCQEGAVCTKADNMGWRYFMLAMGGFSMIMFIIRFFLFKLYESPKFLMGRGKDAAAIEVVHEVARRNGKTTDITIADLDALNGPGGRQQTTLVLRSTASWRSSIYRMSVHCLQPPSWRTLRRLSSSSGALLGSDSHCITHSYLLYKQRVVPTLATVLQTSPTATLS